MAFIIAVTFGLFAFCATADAIYKPKPVPPAPPTIPEVWKTIASAQQALEDGYDLIYGRLE